MKYWKLLCADLMMLLFCSSLVRAQDFETAIKEVIPQGVEIGMSSSSLKQTRPSLLDGPTAANPRGEPHQTFMETQGLGKPGYVSFWYLTSNNRVVGVMKTKGHAGIAESVFVNQAQRLFVDLTVTLGTPSQEKILRKADESFIPVRADVWKDPASGLMIYFVATTKEITTAVIGPSDFPLSQVFIRPDPQRFPLEQPKEVSIRDIDRAPPEQQSGLVDQVPRSNEQLDAVPASGNHQESPRSNPRATNPREDEQTATPKNTNYVVWVLSAVVLLGLAAIFAVRKSRSY